jgi:hypothetical protein
MRKHITGNLPNPSFQDLTSVQFINLTTSVPEYIYAGKGNGIQEENFR